MPVPMIARLLGAGLLSAEEITAARTAAGILPSMQYMRSAFRAAEALGEDEDEVPESLEIPVSSSAIRGIGWRKDGVIIVHFIRGGTYTYDGTFDLFQAFAAAPSKGQFFNTHFR